MVSKNRNNMNYKQRYNEALKVIEGLYNVVKYQSSTDALLTFQTLEKAFPELAESEDKKMIRIITKALQDINKKDDSMMGDILLEDCIAWLEKQNEVKSMGLNKYYMCINGWHDSRVDFDEGKIYMGDGKYFCDNNNSVTLLGEVDRHFLLITKDNVAQKPAKWGEEDEKMLQFAIEDFQFCVDNKQFPYVYHTETHENVLNWLKSLKERMKEK